ncbi:MAG: TlpA disulfide reductase family protein [Cystobacter sp.]
MSSPDTPLTLLDPEGGWINAPVHIHDLHGRPVLLHFWTERFASSRKQLPRLQALVKEFAPRGLQVIGVHIPMAGQDLERAMDTNELEALVKRLGFHYPIAVDDGSIATAHGVSSTPAYLVFDADLRPRLRALGDEAGERALRPLLEGLTASDSTASASAS